MNNFDLGLKSLHPITLHSHCIHSILCFWMKVLGFVGMVSSSGWAQFDGPSCSMSKNSNFNFYISYEKQKVGMFGDSLDKIPPVVVQNCKTAVGKFLGFGLGLRYSYLSSDTALISYDGNIYPEICRIDNAPVPLSPFPEKKNYFQKQFHFLRSCVYMEVTQLDRTPLNYKPDQVQCKMTPLTPTKIKAEGSFCFLPIQSNTQVALSIVIRPECAQLDFLKKNQISPTDMEAFLQTYVVEDDTGQFINNMIGVAKARVVLLPAESLLPVSQDPPPEEPRFPNQFSTDIHWGELSIKDAGSFHGHKAFLEYSLFVDNRMSCKDNSFCATPSDFQQPLSGEAELSEILSPENTINGSSTGTKRKSLDSFIAGNPFDPFVRPQWQGLFRFGRNTLEAEMVVGKRYELALHFFNPYDDYILLMKRKEQLLVDLTLLNGTAGKDIIRPISGLTGFLGLPLIPHMPALGDQDIPVQLEKVRQFFNSLGSDLPFPPYYTEICSQQQDGELKMKCKSVRKLSRYLEMTLQFTLGEKNEEGQFALRDLVQEKKSPIFRTTTHKETITSLPKLVCP